MTEAARLGDPVEHTSTFGAMIAGAVAGALLGLAIVGTGGAALAIAGAVATGGSIGSAIGELVAAALPKIHSGDIGTGSPTVFVNDRPAARAILDTAKCDSVMALCFTVHPIADGSTTVFIDRAPAARVGDQGECSFTIGAGSADVIIGGGTARYMAVSGEVPGWFKWGMLALGLIGPGMYMRALNMGGAAIAARLGCGLLGGFAFGYAGDRAGAWAFGEGSFLHRLTSFAASLAGSLLGGFLGAKLVPSYPPPSARSQLLADDLVAAFEEQGVNTKDHNALGVLIHDDGSATVALSGKPVKAPQYNHARIGEALKEVSVKHRIEIRFVEQLPQPMFERGCVSSCAEPKIFSSEHPSGAQAMTIRHLGATNNHPHPSYPGNMRPCDRCSEHVFEIIGDRAVQYREFAWAPVGSGADAGVDEVRGLLEAPRVEEAAGVK